MAKQFSSVGILAISLIVFNCYLCAAIENQIYEGYVVDSSNKQHLGSYLSIAKLREKRQTPPDNKNQYESVTLSNNSTTTSSSSSSSNSSSNSSSTAPALPAPSSTAAAASAPTPTIVAQNNSTSASADLGIAYNNRPLLGVNGTGQRKYLPDTPTLSTTIVSEPIQNSGEATKLKAGQYPKKVGATPIGTLPTVVDNEEEQVIGNVDVPEEETDKAVLNHNFTKIQDHHLYYNSTIYVNKTDADNVWNEVKNATPNNLLSNSHRRAMTVALSFDFPFYGHNIRNITVATGGFLYTGEYVHSWLAATQYVAPLMANFDTSLSNDSYVRTNDNGTAFTVVWDNVTLQDNNETASFTFSATLHKTGDIVFAYFKIPYSIKQIKDDTHPVKIGLSDAYIVDKVVYFTRRKTIFEYHRVTFASVDITNSTLIYLTALPNCLSYTDCEACLNHNTTFECTWCPTSNRCSTGTDRRRQEWQQKGCESTSILTASQCPPLGTRGNKPNQPNTSSSTPNKSDSNTNNNNNNNDKTTSNNNDSNTHTTNSESSNSKSSEESDVTATNSSLNHAVAKDVAKAALADQVEPKSMSTTLYFMMPVTFILFICLWVLYAYRNPHTKSGQLLIQYRPSQWSWRRGEARYTAATIHM